MGRTDAATHAAGGRVGQVVKLRQQSPGVQEQVQAAIKEAVALVQCLEGWAEDDGFEDRAEAIRRLQKMREWCAAYYRLYDALERQLHQEAADLVPSRLR